jgi:hypothetical protein
VTLGGAECGLQHEHISIAFTTYQTNRLILLGSNPESGLTVKEQVFDKPMGLYGNDHSLYMSTRYQIWQLDNCLVPGEIHQQSDRLCRWVYWWQPGWTDE